MLVADLSTQGIAYANSKDLNQAQQNVGLDLRSKLFDNLTNSAKQIRTNYA